MNSQKLGCKAETPFNDGRILSDFRQFAQFVSWVKIGGLNPSDFAAFVMSPIHYSHGARASFSDIQLVMFWAMFWDDAIDVLLQGSPPDHLLPGSFVSFRDTRSSKGRNKCGPGKIGRLTRLNPCKLGRNNLAALRAVRCRARSCMFLFNLVFAQLACFKR